MSELTTSIREEAYAMSHADRLANVRRSHSSEGDVDVAAFAVCAHPKEVSYVSELTTRLLLDGHAWLIAVEDGVRLLVGRLEMHVCPGLHI